MAALIALTRERDLRKSRLMAGMARLYSRMCDIGYVLVCVLMCLCCVAVCGSSVMDAIRVSSVYSADNGAYSADTVFLQ